VIFTSKESDGGEDSVFETIVPVDQPSRRREGREAQHTEKDTDAENYSGERRRNKENESGKKESPSGVV
jgi:hypothetical protein